MKCTVIFKNKTNEMSINRFLFSEWMIWWLSCLSHQYHHQQTRIIHSLMMINDHISHISIHSVAFSLSSSEQSGLFFLRQQKYIHLLSLNVKKKNVSGYFMSSSLQSLITRTMNDFLFDKKKNYYSFAITVLIILFIESFFSSLSIIQIHTLFQFFEAWNFQLAFWIIFRSSKSSIEFVSIVTFFSLSLFRFDHWVKVFHFKVVVK